MCQTRGAIGYAESGGCTCGGCECGPSFRSFFSSKEQQERLQAYRDQLKMELAGVEERIKELKGK